jgi:hypothetical protein
LLGSPAEEEEEEEEEEKDGPLETLEELVLGLASEVCGDFLFYCGDTHGSFVVRTLLQVLGGTLLESERVRPRGSQSSGKYYKKGRWNWWEVQKRVTGRISHYGESLALNNYQRY